MKRCAEDTEKYHATKYTALPRMYRNIEIADYTVLTKIQNKPRYLIEYF